MYLKNCTIFPFCQIKIHFHFSNFFFMFFWNLTQKEIKTDKIQNYFQHNFNTYFLSFCSLSLHHHYIQFLFLLLSSGDRSVESFYFEFENLFPFILENSIELVDGCNGNLCEYKIQFCMKLMRYAL